MSMRENAVNLEASRQPLSIYFTIPRKSFLLVM